MNLTKLDSDDIAQVFFAIATPKALRSVLRSHKAIAAFRKELAESMDARREIEEFVRERLFYLKPKTYFSHEPAFCALAVALETLPMPASEDFLSELAALKIAEMPLSSRVAALCLQRHRELFPSTTEKLFKVGLLPIPKAPSLNIKTTQVASGLSNNQVWKKAA